MYWKNISTGIVCFVFSGFVYSAEALILNYQEQSNSIVRNAVSEQQKGVAGLLFGRQLQELSRQKVTQLAITQAPQILANEQQRVIAESGLVRQDSAFDWIIGATATFTNTNFNARSESITRERVTDLTISGDSLNNPDSEQELGEDGVPIAISDSAGNLLCVTVDGQVVNESQCALTTEITTENEFAAGDADSTNALSFTTQGTKQINNGAQFNMGLGISKRTKNFYPLDDLGLISAQSSSDPIGKGSRFPWTSRIFVGYTTPLPFGKNFGRYGSVASLGRELSKINDRQSRHSEQAVLELLLLQVDNSYWNHVRSLLNLQSSRQRSNNVNDRLASAKRKYDARGLTKYELIQVQLAASNAAAQLENAWFNFVRTSQKLSQLINLGSTVIILPSDFNADFDEHKVITRSAFRKSVLTGNPGLNASREGIKNNEVLLKNAEQNLKPDLSVALNLELSQSDRVLGYEEVGDSLGALFDPDNTQWFIGIQYRLPFGHHAEKARHTQASISLTKSKEAHTLQELQLSAEINELITRNDTTLSQLGYAEDRLTLAQVAFDKGQRARDSGQISEFEFLTILDDLDSARDNWVNQLVSQQRITAQALVLEGKFSTEIGGAQ